MKRAMVLVSALTVALATSVPQAQAQKKLYRCGSNYQDRPCDAAPAAAAKPAAATPAPAAASERSTTSAADSRAAYQKQLRCDNYGRQIDELHQKQKASPQYAGALDAQIKSLEGRMKGDSC